MGYLIIRRAYKDTSYIGWMEDTDPISGEMVAWAGFGHSTEILEYVPDRDPRNDPFLIPQLNLWRDQLEGREHAEHGQP